MSKKRDLIPPPSTNAGTPLSKQQATDITIHSKLNGAIDTLGVYARSLLFAEFSMVAYLSEEETRKAVSPLGFHSLEFFEKDGAQAYAFTSDTDLVIACRGTEPNEWNDIRADLDAATAVAETMGRVHRGFKSEVDDLWPLLEKALKNNDKKLWFTGHSLGGAMATICAGRCLLSHINSVPEQIFTFGSPRVGDERYINHAKVNYLRWVNNNDIVTRVPPNWMGYQHTGTEMYLNAFGQLRNMNKFQRGKDRWRGFLRGLKTGEFDHFSDHIIDRYVEYIYNEAKTRGELS